MSPGNSVRADCSFFLRNPVLILLSGPQSDTDLGGAVLAAPSPDLRQPAERVGPIPLPGFGFSCNVHFIKRTP